MRVGGGANATLSIPRDTVVDIPGHGRNKINAAYAIGGPSLAIKTVESYLGIDVNHLVEVNFENFPQLIDSLGGITYKGGCVVSKINGGTRNGGYTLRLKAGEHEIDGKQALALARTRKNDCAKREDDRTRARRQQKILGAIKDKVISFETFVRLPWVTLGGAARGSVGHGRPDAARARRRRADRRQARTRACSSPRAAITLPDGGAGLVVDDAEKQRRRRALPEGLTRFRDGERDAGEDQHEPGDRRGRDRLVEQQRPVEQRHARREVGDERRAARADLVDQLVEDHERQRGPDGAEHQHGRGSRAARAARSGASRARAGASAPPSR